MFVVTSKRHRAKTIISLSDIQMSRFELFREAAESRFLLFVNLCATTNLERDALY